MEAPATTPKIFVLELSEQEWKENHQMGAFAGMKISYIMEGDRYKIEMTGEQYEKYKKNCGEFAELVGYRAVLIPTQLLSWPSQT